MTDEPVELTDPTLAPAVEGWQTPLDDLPVLGTSPSPLAAAEDPAKDEKDDSPDEGEPSRTAPASRGDPLPSLPARTSDHLPHQVNGIERPPGAPLLPGKADAPDVTGPLTTHRPTDSRAKPSDQVPHAEAEALLAYEAQLHALTPQLREGEHITKAQRGKDRQGVHSSGPLWDLITGDAGFVVEMNDAEKAGRHLLSVTGQSGAVKELPGWDQVINWAREQATKDGHDTDEHTAIASGTAPSQLDLNSDPPLNAPGPSSAPADGRNLAGAVAPPSHTALPESLTGSQPAVAPLYWTAEDRAMWKGRLVRVTSVDWHPERTPHMAKGPGQKLTVSWSEDTASGLEKGSEQVHESELVRIRLAGDEVRPFPGAMLDGETAVQVGPEDWQFTNAQGHVYRLCNRPWGKNEGDTHWVVGHLPDSPGGTLYRWIGKHYPDLNYVLSWIRRDGKSRALAEGRWARHPIDPDAVVPFSLDAEVTELEEGFWKVTRYGREGRIGDFPWGYIIGPWGGLPENETRRYSDGMKWDYAIHCITQKGFHHLPTERLTILKSHWGMKEDCATGGPNHLGSCKRHEPRFLVEVEGEGRVVICARHLTYRLTGCDSYDFAAYHVAREAWEVSGKKRWWTDWQERAYELTWDLVAPAVDKGLPVPDVRAALLAEAQQIREQREAREAAMAAKAARRAEREAAKAAKAAGPSGDQSKRHQRDTPSRKSIRSPAAVTGDVQTALFPGEPPVTEPAEADDGRTTLRPAAEVQTSAQSKPAAATAASSTSLAPTTTPLSPLASDGSNRYQAVRAKAQQAWLVVDTQDHSIPWIWADNGVTECFFHGDRSEGEARKAAHRLSTDLATRMNPPEGANTRYTRPAHGEYLGKVGESIEVHARIVEPGTPADTRGERLITRRPGKKSKVAPEQPAVAIAADGNLIHFWHQVEMPKLRARQEFHVAGAILKRRVEKNQKTTVLARVSLEPSDQRFDRIHLHQAAPTPQWTPIAPGDEALMEEGKRVRIHDPESPYRTDDTNVTATFGTVTLRHQRLDGSWRTDAPDGRHLVITAKDVRAIETSADQQAEPYLTADPTTRNPSHDVPEELRQQLIKLKYGDLHDRWETRIVQGDEVLLITDPHSWHTVDVVKPYVFKLESGRHRNYTEVIARRRDGQVSTVFDLPQHSELKAPAEYPARPPIGGPIRELDMKDITNELAELDAWSASAAPDAQSEAIAGLLLRVDDRRRALARAQQNRSPANTSNAAPAPTGLPPILDQQFATSEDLIDHLKDAQARSRGQDRAAEDKQAAFCRSMARRSDAEHVLIPAADGRLAVVQVRPGNWQVRAPHRLLGFGEGTWAKSRAHAECLAEAMADITDAAGSLFPWSDPWADLRARLFRDASGRTLEEVLLRLRDEVPEPPKPENEFEPPLQTPTSAPRQGAEEQIPSPDEEPPTVRVAPSSDIGETRHPEDQEAVPKASDVVPDRAGGEEQDGKSPTLPDNTGWTTPLDDVPILGHTEATPRTEQDQQDHHADMPAPGQYDLPQKGTDQAPATDPWTTAADDVPLLTFTAEQAPQPELTGNTRATVDPSRTAKPEALDAATTQDRGVPTPQEEPSTPHHFPPQNTWGADPSSDPATAAPAVIRGQFADTELRPARLLYPDGTPLHVHAPTEEGADTEATSEGAAAAPWGTGNWQAVRYRDGSRAVIHPALISLPERPRYPGVEDASEVARWEALDRAEATGALYAEIPVRAVMHGDLLGIERRSRGTTRTHLYAITAIRLATRGRGRKARSGLEFTYRDPRGADKTAFHEDSGAVLIRHPETHPAVTGPDDGRPITTRLLAELYQHGPQFAHVPDFGTLELVADGQFAMHHGYAGWELLPATTATTVHADQALGVNDHPLPLGRLTDADQARGFAEHLLARFTPTEHGGMDFASPEFATASATWRDPEGGTLYLALLAERAAFDRAHDRTDSEVSKFYMLFEAAQDRPEPPAGKQWADQLTVGDGILLEVNDAEELFAIRDHHLASNGLVSLTLDDGESVQLARNALIPSDVAQPLTDAAGTIYADHQAAWAVQDGWIEFNAADLDPDIASHLNLPSPLLSGSRIRGQITDRDDHEALHLSHLRLLTPDQRRLTLVDQLAIEPPSTIIRLRKHAAAQEEDWSPNPPSPISQTAAQAAERTSDNGTRALPERAAHTTDSGDGSAMPSERPPARPTADTAREPDPAPDPRTPPTSAATTLAPAVDDGTTREQTSAAPDGIGGDAPANPTPPKPTAPPAPADPDGPEPRERQASPPPAIRDSAKPPATDEPDGKPSSPVNTAPEGKPPAPQTPTDRDSQTGPLQAHAQRLADQAAAATTADQARIQWEEARDAQIPADTLVSTPHGTRPLLPYLTARGEELVRTEKAGDTSNKTSRSDNETPATIAPEPASAHAAERPSPPALTPSEAAPAPVLQLDDGRVHHAPEDAARQLHQDLNAALAAEAPPQGASLYGHLDGQPIYLLREAAPQAATKVPPEKRVLYLGLSEGGEDQCFACLDQADLTDLSPDALLQTARQWASAQEPVLTSLRALAPSTLQISQNGNGVLPQGEVSHPGPGHGPTQTEPGDAVAPQPSRQRTHDTRKETQAPMTATTPEDTPSRPAPGINESAAAAAPKTSGPTVPQPEAPTHPTPSTPSPGASQPRAPQGAARIPGSVSERLLRLAQAAVEGTGLAPDLVGTHQDSHHLVITHATTGDDDLDSEIARLIRAGVNDHVTRASDPELARYGVDVRVTQQQGQATLNDPAVSTPATAAGADNDRLYRLLEEAAELFAAELKSSTQEAKSAANYLTRKRSHDVRGELVSRWKVGHARRSRHATVADKLRERGYTDQELLRTGLLRLHEETDRLNNAFWHRLMWPVRDLDGRVIGFTGRTLGDPKDYKYVNTATASPDGPRLYQKSKVLLGMERLRTTQGPIYLGEGPFELMAVDAAHQAADQPLPASVGTCGTSLTAEHAKVLRDFCTPGRPLIWLLNNDKNRAAEKALLRNWHLVSSLPGGVLVVKPTGANDFGDIHENSDQGPREVLRQIEGNRQPLLDAVIDADLLLNWDPTVEDKNIRSAAAAEIVADRLWEYLEAAREREPSRAELETLALTHARRVAQEPWNVPLKDTLARILIGPSERTADDHWREAVRQRAEELAADEVTRIAPESPLPGDHMTPPPTPDEQSQPSTTVGSETSDSRSYADRIPDTYFQRSLTRLARVAADQHAALPNVADDAVRALELDLSSESEARTAASYWSELHPLAQFDANADYVREHVAANSRREEKQQLIGDAAGQMRITIQEFLPVAHTRLDEALTEILTTPGPDSALLETAPTAAAAQHQLRTAEEGLVRELTRTLAQIIGTTMDQAAAAKIGAGGVRHALHQVLGWDGHFFAKDTQEPVAHFAAATAAIHGMAQATGRDLNARLGLTDTEERERRQAWWPHLIKGSAQPSAATSPTAEAPTLDLPGQQAPGEPTASAQTTRTPDGTEQAATEQPRPDAVDGPLDTFELTLESEGRNPYQTSHRVVASSRLSQELNALLDAHRLARRADADQPRPYGTLRTIPMATSAEALDTDQPALVIWFGTPPDHPVRLPHSDLTRMIGSRLLATLEWQAFTSTSTTAVLSPPWFNELDRILPDDQLDTSITKTELLELLHSYAELHADPEPTEQELARAQEAVALFARQRPAEALIRLAEDGHRWIRLGSQGWTYQPSPPTSTVPAKDADPIQVTALEETFQELQAAVLSLDEDTEAAATSQETPSQQTAPATPEPPNTAQHAPVTTTPQKTLVQQDPTAAPTPTTPEPPSSAESGPVDEEELSAQEAALRLSLESFAPHQDALPPGLYSSLNDIVSQIESTLPKILRLHNANKRPLMSRALRIIVRTSEFLSTLATRLHLPDLISRSIERFIAHQLGAPRPGTPAPADQLPTPHRDRRLQDLSHNQRSLEELMAKGSLTSDMRAALQRDWLLNRAQWFVHHEEKYGPAPGDLIPTESHLVAGAPPLPNIAKAYSDLISSLHARAEQLRKKDENDPRADLYTRAAHAYQARLAGNPAERDYPPGLITRNVLRTAALSVARQGSASPVTVQAAFDHQMPYDLANHTLQLLEASGIVGPLTGRAPRMVNVRSDSDVERRLSRPPASGRILPPALVEAPATEAAGPEGDPLERALHDRVGELSEAAIRMQRLRGPLRNPRPSATAPKNAEPHITEAQRAATEQPVSTGPAYGA
ncbi:hypothetical protein [Streptomyces sp. NPDC001933]|uniref:hypothetical protein n=1 Tax=Streptomyces sp. NPDC001933 TaxID=3364626 RepID=UPI0036B80476